MKPDCLDAAVSAPDLIDVALPAAETAGMSGAGIRRDARIWYGYLMLGFFSYLLNIQGNIVPFLRAELDLSYRAVSLHTSAFAAGLILVGLFGDRVIRGLGRRHTLWIGMIGASAGAIVLCLAPNAVISIGGCAILGAVGGLIPATVFTSLADVFGERRNVAYSEANAVSYAFGIVAPLATSLVMRSPGTGGPRSSSASPSASSSWRVSATSPSRVRQRHRRWGVPSCRGASGHTGARSSWWWRSSSASSSGLPPISRKSSACRRRSAAAGVAVFFLAVLVARIAGSGLVRVIAGTPPLPDFARRDRDRIRPLLDERAGSDGDCRAGSARASASRSSTR